MSSVDISAIASELKSAILGARIDNIYQINPLAMLLNLHQREKPRLSLILDAGRRIHLTSYGIEKPPKPSMFCMILRKHLNGGIIENVEQHEFERVISIDVKMKGESYRLIAEFFSQGNIILVDPRNTIIVALTYRKMRDRNILKGEHFLQAPPSGLNPQKIAKNDLTKLREKGDTELVKGLVNLLSIGGTYAEEILLNAKIDKRIPCKTLSDQQIAEIYDAVEGLILKLKEGKFEPCIILDEKGSWTDVSPLHLLLYQGMQTKQYPTFNKAADDYFTKISTEKEAETVESKFGEQIAKHNDILKRQETQLEELQLSIKTNQTIGNLIYAHLNELQTLTQNTVDEKKAGKEWALIASDYAHRKEKGLSPEIYFDSFLPEQLMVNVKIDGTSFPLYLQFSIQQNAAKYYEKAKKAQKKVSGLQDAMEKTLREINALKQKEMHTIKEIPKIIIVQEKAWYEKFHWFNSSEGFLIIGGKDATTNDLIIKRYTEPQDIVLHGDIIGAPFVVIKTGGKNPTDIVLHEAAEFAASYSKAWREGAGSIDIYWVKPEQLSKTPPSGQYIQKGMFMINGKRNYIRNVELRLAVGIKKINEDLTPVGGPVSAVEAQTKIYVEIIPGKRSSSEIAKQIKIKLANRFSSPANRQILGLNDQLIQRFIPAGKGELAHS